MKMQEQSQETPRMTPISRRHAAQSCRHSVQSHRDQKPGMRRRRGAAAAEFAVVAPIFLLMVFGIVEIGRGLMVQQLLTNASRVGARRAVMLSASNSDVIS